MKPKNSVPSPTGSSLSAKLKRSLLLTLASSGAFAMMLTPLLVSASIFSIPAFLSGLTKQTEAAGGSQNSQTLSLLSPATNIDPRAAVGGGDITLVGGSALLPQEGPSGTAADIADDPSSSAISTYTVHKGDTLAGIAKMYGVTVNTIVWANNTSVIHEGDQLIILPVTGLRYTIIKGDTLAGIAAKYKADAKEIAQFNDLSSDIPLVAGNVILIPNGEAPPTASQIAQTTHAKAIKKAISSGEPFLGGSGPAISGYYSWPVQGGVVTQGLHGWNAVDLGAPKGNSIYAAADGVVIIAKSNSAWNGGYGNYVVVSHPNGTQTLYAHMSKVLTSVGAQVSQGDTIGKVGSTGESTGPHLHFEIRGAVNPFAN